MNKVLVIGAGASGMMAALTAAEDKNNRVVLVERQARVGRKLAATGNGRCNITNSNASLEHYHGENPEFVCYALEHFGSRKTMDYFNNLGLVLSEQHGGRVYPLSDSANSVIDVLRFAVESAGIELNTGVQIRRMGKKSGKLYAFTDSGVYEADRVIIACGGKAGAKLGGVGDGYELLSQMGHSITKLYPALVPVTTENELVRSLKGIRTEAELTLGNSRSRGELQFTDNGISGPAAFDISRKASVEGGSVKIDFLTGDVMPMLLRRRENNPELESQYLFTGILHSRLGLALVKYSGIRPSEKIRNLRDDELRRAAESCSDFRLKIKGTGSFDNAQITVGGARTDEFNPKTLESRLVPGLYACGEVLDIDGDCGGFNLQWAWSSGRLAGRLLR